MINGHQTLREEISSIKKRNLALFQGILKAEVDYLRQLYKDTQIKKHKIRADIWQERLNNLGSGALPKNETLKKQNKKIKELRAWEVVQIQKERDAYIPLEDIVKG